MPEGLPGSTAPRTLVRKVQAASANDLASTVSSDFEEVHLEDMEHSGSGEEVDWTHPSEEANSERKDASKPGSVKAGAAPPTPQAPPSPPPSAAAAPQAEIMPETSWRGASSRGVPPRPVVDPGLDPLIKDIESATHKAAEMARDAAKEVSTKLMGSAAEARLGLSKLATDVSSWWSALDPASKSAPSTPMRAAAPDKQAGEDVAALFGLAAGDELVEAFECTLVQECACTHNAFTPSAEVAVAGKLYITEKHACFRGAHTQFAVPHVHVARASKQLPRGGSPFTSKGALRLDLPEGAYVVFRDFRDANAPLALLEHLTEKP